MREGSDILTTEICAEIGYRWKEMLYPDRSDDTAARMAQSIHHICGIDVNGNLYNATDREEATKDTQQGAMWYLVDILFKEVSVVVRGGEVAVVHLPDLAKN